MYCPINRAGTSFANWFTQNIVTKGKLMRRLIGSVVTYSNLRFLTKCEKGAQGVSKSGGNASLFLSEGVESERITLACGSKIWGESLGGNPTTQDQRVLHEAGQSRPWGGSSSGLPPSKVHQTAIEIAEASADPSQLKRLFLSFLRTPPPFGLKSVWDDSHDVVALSRSSCLCLSRHLPMRSRLKQLRFLAMTVESRFLTVRSKKRFSVE